MLLLDSRGGILRWHRRRVLDALALLGRRTLRLSFGLMGSDRAQEPHGKQDEPRKRVRYCARAVARALRSCLFLALARQGVTHSHPRGPARDMRVPEAIDDVVIEHPHRLHERVCAEIISHVTGVVHVAPA